ncbi:hypothetical protein EF913_32270 [Streptomyces sp. WAC04189]|uniref:hypothetical protein n=1 Tax=Streptomyces TaxID=1883 RepID=UPI000F9FDDE9|nr:hypothetical protein [Streptomyces sp. WAC04189]RSR96833.1 hypothetical protein EF913_32270 [Streptomyces sp. WAC04189]
MSICSEETYRTYRHLMPDMITKAARILGAGLWEAASWKKRRRLALEVGKENFLKSSPSPR